ncbi:MAG: hypothetical protein ACKO37_02760 [Vampirovibrionales bacterium]
MAVTPLMFDKPTQVKASRISFLEKFSVCLLSVSLCVMIGLHPPAMAKKKLGQEPVSRDVRVTSLDDSREPKDHGSSEDKDPATLLLQLKTQNTLETSDEDTHTEVTTTEDLGLGLWLVRFPLTLYSKPTKTADSLTFSQNKLQHVGYSSPQEPTWQPLGMVREYFEFTAPQHNLYALRVLDELETDPQWIQVKTPFALSSDQDTTQSHTAWIYIPDQQAAPVVVKRNKQQINASLSQGNVLGMWESASMVDWADFMRETTKLHGYYWRAGVSAHLKSVLSRPEEGAAVLPMKALKDVRILHARGGWLMVEVRDIMATGWQIGWIRWRDDAGKLLLYPDF